MAYDPADLVRRFEPILYLAKGERFVPSDCKRYLERSALWNSGKPRDAKTSWGQGGPGFPRKPAIARGRISALPGEPSLTGSGQFLGQSQSGGFPFLFNTGGEEGFLDLTGWKDDRGVTKSSENRFADVDDIAVLYKDVAAGGDPFLAKSRLWYHAEIFDALRLRPLLAREGTPRDIKDLFSTLVDPLLLCYYLFFPAHDEGIACSDDFEDKEIFGSFAGEWACLAILLRGNNRQSSLSRLPPG